MSIDPNQLNQAYSPPRAIAEELPTLELARPKHSGPGIAGFTIAILAGVSAAAVILIAGVVEMQTPGGMDEQSAAAIIVGLAIFAVIGVALVGLSLSVAGLFQADRLRIFAILGVVFNLVVLFGIGGIILIGMTMA